MTQEDLAFYLWAILIYFVFTLIILVVLLVVAYNYRTGSHSDCDGSMSPRKNNGTCGNGTCGNGTCG